MPGTKIFYISGKDSSSQRSAHVGCGCHTAARVGAFQITADSQPVLDGWGWGDYWGCAEWMLWHSLNKQKYGLPAANQKFIQAWSSQDSTASPFNWCKYNAEFATYFKQQGIEVGWLLSNLITGAQNVGTDVVTVVENVGTGAATASGGIATTGQLIKFILPLAAIGAGAWAFNKYVKKIF